MAYIQTYKLLFFDILWVHMNIDGFICKLAMSSNRASFLATNMNYVEFLDQLWY